MNNINRLKKMNFGFWYSPDEEDYLIPSQEEILLQWHHELQALEIEELEALDQEQFVMKKKRRLINNNAINEERDGEGGEK